MEIMKRIEPRYTDAIFLSFINLNPIIDLLIKDIINNKKIGGNAQYRRKKIIFQHGSIPIEKSINQRRYFCNEIIDKNFSDLNELLGRKIKHVEIEVNLIKAFIEKFGTELKQQNLNKSEKNEIAKILTLKYIGNRWNLNGEL